MGVLTETDLACKIAEYRCRETITESDCVKLAAFLTVRDFLFPQDVEESQYSFSVSSSAGIVNHDSESEFFQTANGMDAGKVWKVIDELMETLQVINPRLYAGVMRKLKD